MNFGVAGALETVIVRGPVASKPALFEAPTLKEKVPSTVGVPESTPVVASVTPGGKVPDCREKAGVGVPVALNVKLYALPTVPLGVGVPAVMTGAPAAV